MTSSQELALIPGLTHVSERERTVSKMPNRCIVGGCSNTPNLENGITLHSIPFTGDVRPQARKRRKKWIDFVKLKRGKWEPTKNSAICSKHFSAEDFQRRFSILPGQEKGSFLRLKTDEFGINVFPKIQAVAASDRTTPVSARSRKMVRYHTFLCCSLL